MKDKLIAELVAEVEKCAAVEKACPANKTHLGDNLCPTCGAGPTDGCHEVDRATYALFLNVRDLVAKAKQGAQ